MEHDIMWLPWEGPGLEHLHLTLPPGRVLADGVIIGIAGGMPFRVRYVIRCDESWRVREVRVSLLDAGEPAIALLTGGDGHWTTDLGESLPDLDGCLDIDLTATPFTNTLPIRRLRLQLGDSADLLVAYLNVPEFRLETARQRYTCLEAGPDRSRYRFETLPCGFTAEILVDADGLVIDYPELFQRVWPQ